MSLSNEPINAEPSMDEILSSIRRILKDDEPVTVAPEPHAEPPAEEPPESVMVLDPALMVSDAPAASPGRNAHTDVPAQEAIRAQPTLSSATPPGTVTDMPYEPQATPNQAGQPGAVEGPQPLIGAQAAEAASSHIGALVRTMVADRNLAISRGGISIEEIVREEIRPMLKSWLDAHLPGLVERVVRAEIERLVGRPDGF